MLETKLRIEDAPDGPTRLAATEASRGVGTARLEAFAHASAPVTPTSQCRHTGARPGHAHGGLSYRPRDDVLGNADHRRHQRRHRQAEHRRRLLDRIGCYLELGDEIIIGNDVSFGPETMILTSTHDTNAGTPERRAVEVTCKPVVIKDGAWLGARCTILPGVTVGEGAIVAAGAVVHRDVAPNTLVAGVPARVVKELR